MSGVDPLQQFLNQLPIIMKTFEWLQPRSKWLFSLGIWVAFLLLPLRTLVRAKPKPKSSVCGSLVVVWWEFFFTPKYPVSNPTGRAGAQNSLNLCTTAVWLNKSNGSSHSSLRCGFHSLSLDLFFLFASFGTTSFFINVLVYKK